MQGLYQQLRQQFSEKNQALEEARKELFLTQEKLMAFQIEMKEKNWESERETEKSFVELLTLAEKEFAHKEKEYQKEIETLHEVITSLA